MSALTAHDFTKGYMKSGFQFGIDIDRTVAVLRRIADDLEKTKQQPDQHECRFNIQSIAVNTLTKPDQFAQSTLIVEFTERLP
jgi:hypothetical protein